jgi:extradiol dioxygenase family protein
LNQPFHLSFVVPDKEKAKEFYLDVLGCSLGRDNETWFDIIFYGHQITIHQACGSMNAFKIDHFGPITSKAEWLKVSEKLLKKGYEFVKKPSIINQNQADESGKFLVNDPSGNLLEFKYYSDFSETVEKIV